MKVIAEYMRRVYYVYTGRLQEMRLRNAQIRSTLKQKWKM